jgi:ATP-dependent DNA ligase
MLSRHLGIDPPGRQTFEKVACSRRRLRVQYNEHVEGDGQILFAHASKLGLEGMVSKHREHPYRSGRSKT